MDKRKLAELLVEHKGKALADSDFTPRELLTRAGEMAHQKEINVITGVRRSGKSTLMRMVARYLIQQENVPSENILYLNFEDDRFAEFKTPDFQTLYEAYLEVESPSGRKYFFLDEIQNLPGWHRWLNRLYEFEDVKLFVTGSNSSMMKGEAAMSLTGRNRVVTLYPFSFREYAAACDVTWTERDLLTGEGKAKLARLFGRYMQEGGFPEALRQQDSDILRHYFGDIVYRDIVARYGLRNVREIRELALYLASNLSCLASYKKLKDTITVNSLTTVKNYLGYFEDVYLFFPVNLFDYSMKRQMYNPAKLYCVDHALAAAMAFKFSADSGRILENIVFCELKRRGCDVYYWKDKNGKEVDFLIRQGQEITAALQVCQNIGNPETRKREISGALAAAAAFGLSEVQILTADYESEEILQNVRILYKPVWRWLVKEPAKR